jgi:hypothetical protein
MPEDISRNGSKIPRPVEAEAETPAMKAQTAAIMKKIIPKVLLKRRLPENYRTP